MVGRWMMISSTFFCFAASIFSCSPPSAPLSLVTINRISNSSISALLRFTELTPAMAMMPAGCSPACSHRLMLSDVESTRAKSRSAPSGINLATNLEPVEQYVSQLICQVCNRFFVVIHIGGTFEAGIRTFET